MKSIQADESRVSIDVIEVKPPVMKEEVSCANSQVNLHDLGFPNSEISKLLGKDPQLFPFWFHQVNTHKSINVYKNNNTLSYSKDEH